MYIAKYSRVCGLLRSANTKFVGLVDVVLRVILGGDTLDFGSLTGKSVNLLKSTTRDRRAYT